MAVASSSSSLACTRETEVFISFRGSDVRRGFLSHLVPALKAKQIHAFIDNDLERGNDITGNLFQVIEQSDLSIVIFSRKYPKSEWCLEELKKIHESMKQRKKRVVPVFYGVDPSDVQDLKGNYAIRLQKWRDALVEISNLSGFDSKNYSTDAQLIDEVVRKVSEILCEICPNISHNEGLFGIDSSINDVEELLQLDSVDGVRMVGIWGMGGIGKTTIASKVFHRNRKKFHGHCFVSNVRETLSTRDGLVILRDKIIRELLGDGEIKIHSAHSVDDSIHRRLKRAKVLLVLDDVLSCVDLTSLLESSGIYSPNSLGRGSRIIVTSRDAQVLKDARFKSEIYEAKELKDIEALQLFSWHAFGKNNPQQGYEKLSEKIVRYANGVPLALVVLGSEFKHKETTFWEDALAKYNTTSPLGIQEILRISINHGLDAEEKNIFLDIACFFKGLRREFVEYWLKTFGFHARVGIDRLIDKSILKEVEQLYGEGAIITMHDLLEQLGKKIVAEEKESKVHQSRLWTYKDVKDALTNTSVWTENVEMIWLREYGDKIDIDLDAFIHMHKLRFLKIEFYSSFHGVNCPMGLEFLPSSIKFLQWDHFSQNYWPSNYKSENLVELHLKYSQLKKIVWSKPLDSLKVICLCRSENLNKIDLAMAPNLEVVDLSKCERLAEIGSSLKHLKKLTSLNLYGCKRVSHLPELPCSIEDIELALSGIREFPSTFGRLIQLKKLSLRSCRQLETLPSSISSLISLEVLDLSDCSRLVEIGSSLENLKKLTRLDVSNCTSLSSLPEIPSSNVELVLTSGMKRFPSIFGHLTIVVKGAPKASLSVRRLGRQLLLPKYVT